MLWVTDYEIVCVYKRNKILVQIKSIKTKETDNRILDIRKAPTTMQADLDKKSNDKS